MLDDLVQYIICFSQYKLTIHVQCTQYLYNNYMQLYIYSYTYLQLLLTTLNSWLVTCTTSFCVIMHVMEFSSRRSSKFQDLNLVIMHVTYYTFCNLILTIAIYTLIYFHVAMAIVISVFEFCTLIIIKSQLTLQLSLRHIWMHLQVDVYISRVNNYVATLYMQMHGHACMINLADIYIQTPQAQGSYNCQLFNKFSAHRKIAR